MEGNYLKIIQCDFLFLILSFIVEVYLRWKLQISPFFVSGKTWKIVSLSNTYLPHCILSSYFAFKTDYHFIGHAREWWNFRLWCNTVPCKPLKFMLVFSFEHNTKANPTGLTKNNKHKWDKCLSFCWAGSLWLQQSGVISVSEEQQMISAPFSEEHKLWPRGEERRIGLATWKKELFFKGAIVIYKLYWIRIATNSYCPGKIAVLKYDT